MQILGVIDNINSRSGREIFDKDKTDELIQFMSSLGDLNYIGHGGLSFCFSLNDKLAIKCCNKGIKGSIVVSKKIFLERVDQMKNLGLPILLPIEVLYEDDNWLVYSQPLCRPLSHSEITPIICLLMLDFVGQMIKTNIKIADIFHRNFGIYEGKLCLFDFHEVDTFQSSPNFMITNLYSTMTFLGKNVGWRVLEIGLINIDFVTKDKFGKNRFPDSLVEFLESMYARDYSKVLEKLESCRTYLRKKIQEKITKYQNITINDQGKLNLKSNALYKYQLARQITKDRKIRSVLDARCSYGGIGLKIAQEFPKIPVSLSNANSKELNEAKKTANNCMIYNVSFMETKLNENMAKNIKYDLCLYYSVVHHLLKNLDINKIIEIVKAQTSKYCVIEFPIKGDKLLTRVMKSSQNKENFECLKSLETIRYHLIMNKLKVEQCVKINYDDDQLNRFAFVCSI